MASNRRQELLDEIHSERERQFDLPGSEWDSTNSPNDWIAIASTYLSSGSNRKHSKTSADDFEDDLIKAAAVILAALENIENMRSSGGLR
jgi:hypothetical protein